MDEKNKLGNSDKIDQYLYERMEEADRISFEQEFANNKELAKEVQVHKLEFRAAEILIEEELKTKFESW